tara:strand:- start:324 stop:497 length:174 start_codon:yes stop_codon:yes gene_type:complete
MYAALRWTARGHHPTDDILCLIDLDAGDHLVQRVGLRPHILAGKIPEIHPNSDWQPQ